MRSWPVRTGVIHTHKHYCYGLRKNKADDRFKLRRVLKYISNGRYDHECSEMFNNTYDLVMKAKY